MRGKTWLFGIICLCAAFAQAEADDAQQLIESANSAYRSGDYSRCVDQYRLAIDQGGQNRHVFYDAACCCALSGATDQAFAYLHKAIELGYHDADWLEKDNDLLSLRDDARWADLIRRCKDANQTYLASINQELYRMYQEDQGDRLDSDGELDWARINVRDAKHRDRARALLDAGQVKTSDDYYHAAMIFQHGHDSTSYALARELALTAVRLDSTNGIARWLAAAAKDRYLWSIGKPQWYGTQPHKIDGKWTIDPIDTTAVTDEDRRQWNVPSLAEARRNAEAMNKQSEK